MHTPEDVAQWMVELLEARHELHQSDAVAEIEERFGSEFVYEADNGLPSIDRRVLYHFKKLTGDDVVWQACREDWYKGTGDTAARVTRLVGGNGNDDRIMVGLFRPSPPMDFQDSRTMVQSQPNKNDRT